MTRSDVLWTFGFNYKSTSCFNPKKPDIDTVTPSLISILISYSLRIFNQGVKELSSVAPGSKEGGLALLARKDSANMTTTHPH